MAKAKKIVEVKEELIEEAMSSETIPEVEEVLPEKIEEILEGDTTETTSTPIGNTTVVPRSEEVLIETSPEPIKVPECNCKEFGYTTVTNRNGTIKVCIECGKKA